MRGEINVSNAHIKILLGANNLVLDLATYPSHPNSTSHNQASSQTTREQKQMPAEEKVATANPK
jgi:hypothetical protein